MTDLGLNIIVLPWLFSVLKIKQGVMAVKRAK